MSDASGLMSAQPIAAPLSARAQLATRFLLLVFLAAYLAYPAALPGVHVPLHTLILLAIAVPVLVASRFRVEKELALPYLLFFTLLWFSQIFSAAGPAASFLRFFILAGVAFYVSAYFTRRRMMLQAVSSLTLLLLISALLQIVQFLFPASWLGSWITFTQVQWGWGRFGDRIVYGMFLILGMMVLVTGYGLTRRPWLLAGVPVLMIAGFVNASRGVWIGLAAAIVAFSVISRRGLYGLTLFGMLVASYVVVHQGVQWVQSRPLPADEITVLSSPGPARGIPPAPPASGGVAPTDQVGELAHKVRIELNPLRRQFSEELSSSGRLGIAQAGLAMWADHPLFGVGLGNFATYSATYAPKEQLSKSTRDEERFDPHNVMIAILAETGLLGLLGFLLMIGVIVVMFVRRFKPATTAERLVMTGMLAIVVGVSMVGLAHDVHLDRFWWITLGAWCGVSDPHKPSDLA